MPILQNRTLYKRYNRPGWETVMIKYCFSKWKALLIFSIIFFNEAVVFALPTGKVHILHAESLSVPFSHLEKAVEMQHSGLDVLLFSGGSLDLIRKMTSNNQLCDIFISADYRIIDHIAIPKNADWNIRFASDKIVLCYSSKSAYAKQINADNWPSILLKKEVTWGLTDPREYALGYQTGMMLQLAEAFYAIPQMAEKLIAKRRSEHVFSKESDMIEQLQGGKVDYGWEYLSVAIQHGLKHIILPDQINLGSDQNNADYLRVLMKVRGKEASDELELRGKTITYGVTVPKNAANREGAIAFLQCLFNPMGGLGVLEGMGLTPLKPCLISTEEMKSLLPKALQHRVKVIP